MYVYIYIYICLVRLGNYQDVFLWFPSSTSPNVFVWFPSLVVFYGFRRRRKRFLWFPSLVVFYGFRLLQDRGCLSDGNRKKTTRTFPRRTKYIYIYIHTHNIYIYVYIWGLWSRQCSAAPEDPGRRIYIYI